MVRAIEAGDLTRPEAAKTLGVGRATLIVALGSFPKGGASAVARTTSITGPERPFPKELVPELVCTSSRVRESRARNGSNSEARTVRSRTAVGLAGCVSSAFYLQPVARTGPMALVIPGLRVT